MYGDESLSMFCFSCNDFFYRSIELFVKKWLTLYNVKHNGKHYHI